MGHRPTFRRKFLLVIEEVEEKGSGISERDFLVDNTCYGRPSTYH